MKDIVNVFKSMGDETRVKILLLLAHKNVCAKGIAKHVNISEAAVSQHIKVLKQNNLITGYKDGYYVIYHTNKELFQKSKDFLGSLINEDLQDYKEKFDIQEFNILDCKTNCKSMKKCCKKRLEEEI